MTRNDPTERLGLSIPYDWWPAAPILKEIEAAGFSFVQVPSPPPSVLTVPRDANRHAAALADTLGTGGLNLILHGPGSVRAGTRDGDNALAGLISYAAEVNASHVVYHAANLPDVPASEDGRLAETRSLAALATRAERLGVIVALENLAPSTRDPTPSPSRRSPSGRWRSGSHPPPSGSASTSATPTSWPGCGAPIRST
jgi:sugar phosphate isomerase/epimerase